MKKNNNIFLWLSMLCLAVNIKLFAAYEGKIEKKPEVQIEELNKKQTELEEKKKVLDREQENAQDTIIEQHKKLEDPQLSRDVKRNAVRTIVDSLTTLSTKGQEVGELQVKYNSLEMQKEELKATLAASFTPVPKPISERIKEYVQNLPSLKEFFQQLISKLTFKNESVKPLIDTEKNIAQIAAYLISPETTPDQLSAYFEQIMTKEQKNPDLIKLKLALQTRDKNKEIFKNNLIKALSAYIPVRRARGIDIDTLIETIHEKSSISELTNLKNSVPRDIEGTKRRFFFLDDLDSYYKQIFGMGNPYEILNIAKTATQEEILEAYDKIKNKTDNQTTAFVLLNNAFTRNIIDEQLTLIRDVFTSFTKLFVQQLDEIGQSLTKAIDQKITNLSRQQ